MGGCGIAEEVGELSHGNVGVRNSARYCIVEWMGACWYSDERVMSDESWLQRQLRRVLFAMVFHRKLIQLTRR